MAAALIGGAALGAVAGELLKAIIVFKKRAGTFKSRLEHLESNLKSLEPRCVEIEELYKELGRYHEIEDFARLLNKGKGLVEKCSKVHRLNIYKKAKLSKDLQKLDSSILHFCSVDLQFQMNTTVLKTSIATAQLSKKFDTFLSIGRSTVNENRIGFGFSYTPRKPPPFTVGFEVPLRELKIKLINDTEVLLLLCGPGGCGKTTLAKTLCHDPEIEGIFGKNIFFLTLSKVPNESALDYLKMMFMEIASPKLVVLDDVWSGSEHLIDRFSEVTDLKILVTSRFELRRFRSLYKLKLLNDEDAKDLFCNSAFHPNDPMPDADLLDKIIRSCYGFPIALTVVGKSLNGQPWVVWQKRVIEISKGQTIFDTEEAILKLLRQSVDDLEVFPRECFLNLASFPEDVNIPVAMLTDMSVELYKQCPPVEIPMELYTQDDAHVPTDLSMEDDESIYALENICQLSDRNLVNTIVTREDPGEAGSFCFERFVTQHDLLRQLAIHESNQGRVEDRARLIIEINKNVIPKEFWRIISQPCSARLVSISTDEKFTSKWSDFQLPNAEVLILNIRTKSYTLPNFMKRMNKLKVLIITNYGFYPSEIDNLQMIGSLSSLRRVRFERISFRCLDVNDVHLNNLTKVSFVMCDIGQALRNCSVHLSERLPSLKELDISCCNDLMELPSGLCDILSLQKLSVTNCHKLSNLPDRFGGLVNLEVLRLHNCIELLELPDSICHLQKLQLLDISDCHSLEQLPEQFGLLSNLKTLIMSQCSNLSDLPFSVMDLENLKWVHCDGEIANLWKLFQSPLRNLNLNIQKKDLNLNWLHRI